MLTLQNYVIFTICQYYVILTYPFYCVDVEYCTLFPLYRLRPNSIVGVSLMPNHDLWTIARRLKLKSRQPFPAFRIARILKCLLMSGSCWFTSISAHF